MTLRDLDKLCRAILAEDHEAQICVLCRAWVHCPSDLEPTPLCHSCAHAVVDAIVAMYRSPKRRQKLKERLHAVTLDQGPEGEVIARIADPTKLIVSGVHRDVVDTLTDLVVALVDLSDQEKDR